MLVGIVPMTSLSKILNVCSDVILPTVAGMVPEM